LSLRDVRVQFPPRARELRRTQFLGSCCAAPGNAAQLRGLSGFWR